MARHRAGDDEPENFQTDEFDFGEHQPSSPDTPNRHADEGEAVQGEEQSGSAGSPEGDTARSNSRKSTSGRKAASGSQRKSRSTRKSSTAGSKSRSSSRPSEQATGASDLPESPDQQPLEVPEDAVDLPTNGDTGQSDAEAPAAASAVADSATNSDLPTPDPEDESPEPAPQSTSSEQPNCSHLPPDDPAHIAALRKLGCRVDVDAHGHVWRIFLYERNKDNALALIHDFPCLQEVWLFGARVSPPMVQQFRETFPHVKVYI